MRFILVAMLLTGCGYAEQYVENADDYVFVDDYVEYDDNRSIIVQDEFKIHVAKFEQVYNTKVHMTITWDTLDEKTMGVCHYWSDGRRKINIDNVKWSKLTVLGQEELIFHELGHCHFDLDHDDTTMNMGRWSNIPRSIMYPYIFGNTAHYAEFQDYYINELGSK